MKTNNRKYYGLLAFMAAGIMTSCVSDPNSPGVEYMPDMYRSSAVEAYVDYGEVQGRYDEEAVTLIENKFNYVPPNGTVPYTSKEGAVDVNFPYVHGAPINADKTHGLYGVRQDSTGYADAANDINPIPYSDEVVKEGEVLFGRFCIHCHGEKGKGDGTIPGTGKYPPPPAYDGNLKDLPAGQIFYSITYGKNAMGSHASQLNKEERWKLVYYVQKLQGKELGVESDTTQTNTADAEDMNGGAADAADAAGDSQAE